MSRRTPTLPPAPRPARPPAPRIDVTAADKAGLTHLDWAAGIARRRARRYRVRPGSAEEDLVVAEAQTRLIELALRFRPGLVPAGGEPGGQFRGWACREVLTAATRECRRLWNAGTFKAVSEARLARRPPVKVVSLSRLKAPVYAPVPGGAVVGSLLAALPRRERLLLRLVFGFDGRPLPLFKAAKRLGLTPARAKALYAESLARLAAARPGPAAAA